VCAVIFAGWVRRARKLTDEQRSAVVSYFSVYKGQVEGVAKLALSQSDPPPVSRAYGLLKTAWEEVRHGRGPSLLGAGMNGLATAPRMGRRGWRCSASLPRPP
jgi:hypothetical protein